MEEQVKTGGLTKGELIFLICFLLLFAVLLKSCLFADVSSDVTSGGVTIDSYQSGNFLVIKGKVLTNPNTEKSQLQIWVRDAVGGEELVDCVYLRPYETGSFETLANLSKMSGPGPYEAFVRWK